MAAVPTSGAEPARTVDDFAERVLGAVLGAQEVQALYMGARLGWYEALAQHGPLTSVELAARTGTAERYAREWLEHQAVCGYLTTDSPEAGPTERRYSLPEAHKQVLTDTDSLAYMTPIAQLVAVFGQHLDRLADVYRSGGGLGWSEFGDAARRGQADANRPLFLHELGQSLLPQVPDLHARLSQGARVADVGCGGGWSSIGIARAYPETRVDGFDLDAPSVELARRNAEAAGVADRVRFQAADAAGAKERYGAVFAFECIHDMADPVGVLTAMREMAGDDGIVIVMDERVAERFTAPGDEIERIMYGYSLFCCLPDGMSHQPSAATGTVMRPSTLETYAREAGFAGIEILPLENDFFRFYRLVQ